MLHIWDTGIATAQENMAYDSYALENLLPDSKPILHLYQWDNPSATYGYFARPDQHLHLERAKERRLQLARRPTGGGIVFHIWDLAFSFLMPAGHRAFSLNTLENYQFVNRAVLEAVSALFPLASQADLIPEDMADAHLESRHFCMAKPTRYDVVFQGKKIAGAAQRKTRKGYLHQGTISLALPHLEFLRGVLRSHQDILDAMASFTFAPLGRCWSPALLQEARHAIQNLLAQQLQKRLAITVQTPHPPPGAPEK